MDKILIRFRKGHDSYIKGDVAGFDEATALDLIQRGLADPLDEKVVEQFENTVIKGTPKMPSNICAICGKEYKTKKGLQSHKKKHE